MGARNGHDLAVVIFFIARHAVRDLETGAIDRCRFHAKREKDFLFHILGIRHARDVLDDECRDDKV